MAAEPASALDAGTRLIAPRTVRQREDRPGVLNQAQTCHRGPHPIEARHVSDRRQFLSFRFRFICRRRADIAPGLPREIVDRAMGGAHEARRTVESLLNRADEAHLMLFARDRVHDMSDSEAMCLTAADLSRANRLPPSQRTSGGPSAWMALEDDVPLTSGPRARSLVLRHVTGVLQALSPIGEDLHPGPSVLARSHHSFGHRLGNEIDIGRHTDPLVARRL